MKVHVDVERCTGHARCLAEAPDVFVLDDLGYNVTEVYDVVVEFEEQATRGAMACPESAITIAES